MTERTDTDTLRHVLRAVRGYRLRPDDVRVTSPHSGVYLIDVRAFDAVVRVRRNVVGGFDADVVQETESGDWDSIADVRTRHAEDVRVVVAAGIAAADALRWDLDDVDDVLDGMSVADMLAPPCPTCGAPIDARGYCGACTDATPNDPT